MINLLIISAALLAWDANDPSEGVGKYVVYHGRNASGPFTNLVETAETSVTLPKLKSGLHYFYVEAVGTNGLTSDPSAVLAVSAPMPPGRLRVYSAP